MTTEEKIKQLERENEVLKGQVDRVQKKKIKQKKAGSWLLRKSSVPLLGVRLKQSITTAINEYKEHKTVSVDAVSDVSSNIIWRVTRIGLFGFFIAIIPSMILVFQTRLLFNQNELITSQNNLVEADRRSSLVFVMSDVLSDLNRELMQRSGERNLSRTLEARIVSLCMSMKPYRYIEEGKLIEKSISPERGQLLFTILKSNLGPESSQDILNAADFHYTYLKDVNLGRGVRLKYARLDHSSLNGVQMPAANLERAELKEARLKHVNLSDAVMIRANLTKANLEKSELQSADLTNANLFASNLTGVDFSGAILWGTKFDNANLTDVILDNAIVGRQDWIAHIADELDLEGADAIAKKYSIKKQGKKQFMLVARK